MNVIPYFEEKLNYNFKTRSGKWFAYYNYKESVRHNSSMYEVTELPYDNAIQEFIQTLREADVSSFVVTEKCTELIPTLWNLVNSGCSLIGLVEVDRSDSEYNVMGDYKVQGFLLSLQSNGTEDK